MAHFAWISSSALAMDAPSAGSEQEGGRGGGSGGSPSREQEEGRKPIGEKPYGHWVFIPHSEMTKMPSAGDGYNDGGTRYLCGGEIVHCCSIAGLVRRPRSF